jgi:hypothetical protein
MQKNLLKKMIEKSNELIAAPSVCPEAKKAAETWLKEVGGDNEKDATKAYLAELQEDITTIDDLVGFAHSDYAKQEFGAEGVKAFIAHAEALKSSGALYCDCPACKAALAIVELGKKIQQ